MPRTTASRIIPHAVGTAASIGLGMIPLHRLPRAVRTGYVVLPAALTTGAALIALQRGAVRPASDRSTPVPGWRRPSLSEGALSLGLGGIAAGSAVAGLRLDRGAEALLRRHGVPAPRVWMGLAAGALTATLAVIEERAPGLADSEDLKERVLELLTEADPMGFDPGQPGGAPGDEYRPEADAIVGILFADGGVTTAQLDEVWEQRFDEPLTPLLGSQRLTALAAGLTRLTSPPSAR
ncbi:MAG: hypothetical protein L0H74_09910 [Brachybacterium sp.]|nr:hypothetical protein [Brachybacterium sp.]